jgi:hypothetical protein
MDELFTKRLLSDLDDDFAKRAPYLEQSGYIVSGKEVKGLLEKLEELNTAPNPPTDVEKICLALNALHPEMRAIVRADATGSFPTSYSTWAPYANAKLASFELRSSSSSPYPNKPHQQHPRQPQQQKALQEHLVPGHERSVCIKCGNLGHSNVLAKRGDRYVCPMYAPNFKKYNQDGDKRRRT